MSRIGNFVWAVVAGALATLLTGPYNSTPAGLVGATWYGFPFTWVRRLVVAPQYYPWAVDTPGLVFDVLFWAIVLGAILQLVGRLRHRDRQIANAS